MVVCRKAAEFGSKLGHEAFVASKGWFRSWKNKYGLTLYKVSCFDIITRIKQICGEAKDAPQESIDNFVQGLPSLLSGYKDSDIYNADETALYYRVLTNKTLETEHRYAVGQKVSKNRVTLLLCGSMGGEKFPPLVIGKYGSPRCFRGIDRRTLPCLYNHSRNGWMTSALFQNWLSNVNQKMISQRRHIILFVDNAPAHRTTCEYSNIRLQFLPPNCTSVIQPMDQGVIRSFKCKYRTILLDHFISNVETAEEDQLVHPIDILQAMYFIKRAWINVHPDVLINTFVKAGFKARIETEVNEPNCAQLEEHELQYTTIDDRLFEEEIRHINIDNDEVS
jgi:hypothetical protein